MDKNKKLMVVGIIAVIGVIGIYIISSLVGMKQYEGYAIDNYKRLSNELYKRNNEIISNKEVLIKSMPKVNSNIDNIEKLVNSETKDMKMNDGIDLANKIEKNITVVINEYQNNKNSINNEKINDIMENIMELDYDCESSQNIFNQSINDKRTGYNGRFSKNIITKQLAKIYGLEKINQYKSE